MYILLITLFSDAVVKTDEKGFKIKKVDVRIKKVKIKKFSLKNFLKHISNFNQKCENLPQKQHEIINDNTYKIKKANVKLKNISIEDLFKNSGKQSNLLSKHEDKCFVNDDETNDLYDDEDNKDEYASSNDESVEKHGNLNKISEELNKVEMYLEDGFDIFSKYFHRLHKELCSKADFNLQELTYGSHRFLEGNDVSKIILFKDFYPFNRVTSGFATTHVVVSVRHPITY